MWNAYGHHSANMIEQLKMTVMWARTTITVATSYNFAQHIIIAATQWSLVQAMAVK